MLVCVPREKVRIQAKLSRELFEPPIEEVGRHDEGVRTRACAGVEGLEVAEEVHGDHLGEVLLGPEPLALLHGEVGEPLDAHPHEGVADLPLRSRRLGPAWPLQGEHVRRALIRNRPSVLPILASDRHVQTERRIRRKPPRRRQEQARLLEHVVVRVDARGRIQTPVRWTDLLEA